MKRCPQCNQQYTDAWISFCSNDGTPLVETEQPRPDFGSRPVETPGSERPTQWLPRQPPSDQGWIAPDERPPMINPVWQPAPAPPRYVRPPSQGLAVASLITSLSGLLLGPFCLGPIPGIVGLIFGFVALSQIKKSPEQFGGKPMALAGTIVGGFEIGIYIVFGLIILLSKLLS